MPVEHRGVERQPEAGVPSPRDWPFVVIGAALVTLGLIANEWVLGVLLTEAGTINNPASRIVLLALDTALVIVGAVFLVQRRQTPWGRMLMAAVATVFALCLAEGAARLWFGVRNSTTAQERALAADLGWRPVPNTAIDGDLREFGRVHVTTGRGGFRLFGDPATTKSKVLVLGDSFTHAAMVSDGETYYHRLALARPDLEVFAIGAGGYGTLQEYLLLDEWADVIAPDLVLLQMHPNDVINNSHALESRSTTDNNQMTRPYWEHGKVVHRFPENEQWGVIYNLARHALLLRLLNVNLHFLRSKGVASVEQTISRDDPDLLRAIETTVELLQKIRLRAGVPVVAFSAMPTARVSSWSLETICARAAVRFIPGVGEAVEAAARAGEKVDFAPKDSHWNARGHAIAAGTIGAWLERERLPD
jgi:hypothetical protein